MEITEQVVQNSVSCRIGGGVRPFQCEHQSACGTQMLFAFCKVIVDELVEERSSSVSAHIQLRNLETCSSNAAGSNGLVM